MRPFSIGVSDVVQEFGNVFPQEVLGVLSPL
jgi:hypothetical protein